MAFPVSSIRSATCLSDINATPLVDVMLVLLIIFMITAPLTTYEVNFRVPVRVDYPDPQEQKEAPMTLHLSGAGGTRMQMTIQDGAIPGVPIEMVELFARMRSESGKKPQPEFNIKSDDSVPYQNVAEILVAAKQAGLTKVSFNDLRARPL